MLVLYAQGRVFCFFPSEPMWKHRKGGVPLQSQSLGGRHRCIPWHLLTGKLRSRLAREPFSSKSRQCLQNGSKSCPLAYMHTKSSHTHTHTRTKTTYFLSFVVPRFYLATQTKVWLCLREAVRNFQEEQRSLREEKDGHTNIYSQLVWNFLIKKSWKEQSWL